MRRSKVSFFRCTLPTLNKGNYSLGKIQKAEALLDHVNNHRFTEADTCFSHWMTLNKKNHAQWDVPLVPQTIKMVTPGNLSHLIDSKQFTGFAPEKRRAIKATLNQMADLLSNPLRCFKLLGELDSDIAQFTLPYFDFSKLEASPLFLMEGITVPERLPEEDLSDTTDDLLIYLVRKKLQSHDIDTAGFVRTFSGFVDTKKANDIVRTGELFIEDAMQGNALIHGIYSHYIQWYLFAAAVEQKTIVLPNDLTLRDMMKIIIDNDLWTSLLDAIEPSEFNDHHFNFYMGPHRLNSALLFCEHTPYLRGYVLQQWYRDAQKLLKTFKETYEEALPYHLMVSAQASAFDKFLTFNPFQKRREAGEIISEKEATRLAKVASIDQRFFNVAKKAFPMVSEDRENGMFLSARASG